MNYVAARALDLGALAWVDAGMGLLDAIKKAKANMLRPPEPVTAPRIDIEKKRVLLIYFFPAMGDALLLAPAVKALLEKDPDRVVLLLRKSAVRPWRLIDLPVKLVEFPDALVLPAGDAGWTDVKEEEEALLRKLEKHKFDVAVDLTLRNEVDSRRWLSVAKERIGFVDSGEDVDALDLSWSVKDERYQAERHWSRYLILPFLPFEVRAPDFEVPFLEDEKAKEKALELYSRDGPRVLIVPGAASQKKRWGEKHFVSVGRFVTVERGGSVVVTGTKDEGPLVRGIVKAIGDGAQAFTGKSLPQLLALVSQADVVVTNDTGPMHIAYLLGKKTISIFTHMSPICWGPPKKSARFVVLSAPALKEGMAGAEDADEVWTRAAIHHLEGLLSG